MMKPLIIVMLAVQVGIFLATAYAILFGKAVEGRRRPVLSSLAVTLVIVAGTSFRIGDSHAGQPGADLIMFGAPFLLGIGICCALMQFRQRRGLDSAP
jgi:hypothetical protein